MNGTGCLCFMSCVVRPPHEGENGHVPAYDPVELRLRLPTRAFPHTRRRTRSLGRALRVIRHGARVRAARAFSAKAVFAISTTRALVERLVIDGPRRRLCGWSQGAAVPSEATFSRAFSDFADSALPSRLHEALIDKTLQGHLVGHVSRDSTAILGREKPAPKSHQAATPKRRRGRPRKSEQRLDKAPPRLARQSSKVGLCCLTTTRILVLPLAMTPSMGNGCTLVAVSSLLKGGYDSAGMFIHLTFTNAPLPIQSSIVSPVL